ncbi:hypothetical protein N7520_008828 [Penicillium odoratum]|uniref:uncharacterized protein n=1 Tax=Penicillium odoratum TaxID=1167516 RepID=UPI002548D8F8|nr:uncharacterized protein N7520_008828 [Penicillium odoratum]KAJ5751911.1 hypothetical protein N7520_008828 [Penicillium odoratum]
MPSVKASKRPQLKVTIQHLGWNQDLPHLNSDTISPNQFNGHGNSSAHHKHASNTRCAAGDGTLSINPQQHSQKEQDPGNEKNVDGEPVAARVSGREPPPRARQLPRLFLQNILTSSYVHLTGSMAKFARFVGPGFLIAVAYIDPGNYSTDVSAGADFKYSLLFVVLISNLFAILLQSLCIKLEVIGSAIALNLLLNIPLVAGCAITLVDVLFLLLFYRPNGSMRGLRWFEFFVMALVLGVVICFCIQLSLIKNQAVGEVFRGYLLSTAIIQSEGLYQSCGILGATVMPHSLFLGSGVVQSRLKEFDVTAGYVDASIQLGSNGGAVEYRLSIHAIRGCMKYSVIELVLALFTFALFVHSAIIIIAGAALYDMPGKNEADLFGVQRLLSQSVAPAAGLVLALALLLSGISAVIVCTMAGQMVNEGMLKWSMQPWLRRLITRSISIAPSIIIAAVVGKDGMDQTLNASQVVLSAILPFVSAPLIYFTCFNRYMNVPVEVGNREGDVQAERVPMRNSLVLSITAVLVWLLIVVMNVVLLVMVGMGKT